jgi:hypothetical protein
MAETSQRKRSLEERLAEHPGLREQVEGLLQEVENEKGRITTADEAEDAVVERLRQMGREALRSWAQQRQQALDAPKNPGERQGGKKNCAG